MQYWPCLVDELSSQVFGHFTSQPGFQTKLRREAGILVRQNDSVELVESYDLASIKSDWQDPVFIAADAASTAASGVSLGDRLSMEETTTNNSGSSGRRSLSGLPTTTQNKLRAARAGLTVMQRRSIVDFRLDNLICSIRPTSIIRGMRWWASNDRPTQMLVERPPEDAAERRGLLTTGAADHSSRTTASSEEDLSEGVWGNYKKVIANLLSAPSIPATQAEIAASPDLLVVPLCSVEQLPHFNLVAFFLVFVLGRSFWYYWHQRRVRLSFERIRRIRSQHSDSSEEDQDWKRVLDFAHEKWRSWFGWIDILPSFCDVFWWFLCRPKTTPYALVTLELEHADVVLLGSCHVGPGSAHDVIEVAEQLRPDAVAIELDRHRFCERSLGIFRSELLKAEVGNWSWEGTKWYIFPTSWTKVVVVVRRIVGRWWWWEWAGRSGHRTEIFPACVGWWRCKNDSMPTIFKIDGGISQSEWGDL